MNYVKEKNRHREMAVLFWFIYFFRLDVSHPVVELGLTGLTSTSRSIRTTCSKSLALLRSSVSVLSVRPRILIASSQIPLILLDGLLQLHRSQL